MSKKLGGDRGGHRCHNMAHTRCVLDKQGYMCMHAPTRPVTHMHAHKRTHARTDQHVKLIAFPRQQWFANAPQYYVVRTLPVLFYTETKILQQPKTAIFLCFIDPTFCELCDRRYKTEDKIISWLVAVGRAGLYLNYIVQATANWLICSVWNYCSLKTAQKINRGVIAVSFPAWSLENLCTLDIVRYDQS